MTKCAVFCQSLNRLLLFLFFSGWWIGVCFTRRDARWFWYQDSIVIPLSFWEGHRMRMAGVKRLVDRLFGRHLMVTNSLTSCGLFALGDLAEQKIEGRSTIDWRRTLRMSAMGLIIGPINHYWYTFLDKRWSGRSHRHVFTKMLTDEICMAPVSACIFYVGEAYLICVVWASLFFVCRFFVHCCMLLVLLFLFVLFVWCWCFITTACNGLVYSYVYNSTRVRSFYGE